MSAKPMIAAFGLLLTLISPFTIAQPNAQAVATFAGGCFWCMEPPFDALEGVISTTSGYIGGHKENPTYKEVSAGITGHTEAVQVVYDPQKVSYEKLLEVYWVNVDPFAVNAQFCDKGSQYRAEIFTHDAEQQRLAKASKAAVSARLKQSVSPAITEATTFYPAEQYHQDYYLNNPIRYTFYRQSCGRDQRLKAVWGDSYSKY